MTRTFEAEICARRFIASTLCTYLRFLQACCPRLHLIRARCLGTLRSLLKIFDVLHRRIQKDESKHVTKEVLLYAGQYWQRRLPLQFDNRCCSTSQMLMGLLSTTVSGIRDVFTLFVLLHFATVSCNYTTTSQQPTPVPCYASSLLHLTQLILLSTRVLVQCSKRQKLVELLE